MNDLPVLYFCWGRRSAARSGSARTTTGTHSAHCEICRTFGECTTAPRHGMVSGCYPLDEFYKCRPESERVKEIRRKLREV